MILSWRAGVTSLYRAGVTSLYRRFFSPKDCRRPVRARGGGCRRGGEAEQSRAAAKVWSEDEAKFYQHVLAQEAAARQMAEEEAEEVFPGWEGEADERDFYKTVLAGEAWSLRPKP